MTKDVKYSWKKIEGSNLKVLIPKNDYKIISKDPKEQIFVFGETFGSIKNVGSGTFGKKESDLVQIEVAIRKCKRVGFFNPA